MNTDVTVYVGCHADKETGPSYWFCHLLGNESIALEVEGDFEIVYPGGKKNQIVKNAKYNFCTCGASRNKPYCDQTHQLVTNVSTGKKDIWENMDEFDRVKTMLVANPDIKSVSKEEYKEILNYTAEMYSDHTPEDKREVQDIGERIERNMLNNL